MGVKICANCKTENDVNNMFCINCGSIDFEEKIENYKEGVESETLNKDKILNNINETKYKITYQQGSHEKENIADKELLLQLLDSKENVIQEWKLSLLPSYTLGRISSKGSVDIDFSKFEGGEYVSRNHGKIFKSKGKWFFVDLESKHGTEIINAKERKKLLPNVEYELFDGDILVLAGSVRLKIVYG